MNLPMQHHRGGLNQLFVPVLWLPPPGMCKAVPLFTVHRLLGVPAGLPANAVLYDVLYDVLLYVFGNFSGPRSSFLHECMTVRTSQ
jgi:hypothetical protein